MTTVTQDLNSEELTLLLVLFNLSKLTGSLWQIN
jgi:hypothetical protein